MSQDYNYQRYLKSLPTQKISDEIIRNIVKKGTGKEMISKRKIIAGEVNDAYEIRLSDNSYTIIRISPHGSPNFQQEQWAIEECKRVGVQVPKILLIKYLNINGKKYGFCLMQKVEGQTLARGNIYFDKLNIGEQKKYLNQAGQILSKIHSISTTGFGKINGSGKSQFKSSDDLIANLSKKELIYRAMASKSDLDMSIIKTALKLLDRLKVEYFHVKPSLNHGDYFRKHFVVKNKKIIGILDWAEVRSDSPAYDFANWDFWVRNPTLTNWLKEGYMNQNLFDENFETIIHLLKISIGLSALEWYCLQNYHKMISEIKRKLTEDVNFFS